jgi:hypothetical protein
MESANVDKEVEVQRPLLTTTNDIPTAPGPCGEAMPANTTSVTSVVPTVVLRGEEYLPTFSGDPDEDPELFMAEVQEFFRRTPECLLARARQSKTGPQTTTGSSPKVQYLFYHSRQEHFGPGGAAPGGIRNRGKLRRAL